MAVNGTMSQNTVYGPKIKHAIFTELAKSHSEGGPQGDEWVLPIAADVRAQGTA